MKKFTGHDKRVTLSMARCSAVCSENLELMKVLQLLPSIAYELHQLPKAALEILYAEFDEELEAKIKAEFEADPGYLTDLGHAYGVCPLCGHVGCRWIFKIRNIAGGQSIECGSECIITHGLCVKGAETAEHAKKALEAAIRRQIRKLEIKAWHKEYGFEEHLFSNLETELRDIQTDHLRSRKINKRAFCMRRYDLPKLRKYYARTGWLGTELRWKEWRRLVLFTYEQAAGEPCLPHPKPWIVKPKKKKKAKKEEPKSGQTTLFSGTE